MVEHKNPLYTSNYENHRCFTITIDIIIVEFILFFAAVILFPDFFINDSLKGLYCTQIASAVLLWSYRLKVIYFYENHFVLYYPLRIFRKKITYMYDDVASIVYHYPYAKFSEEHLRLHMKNGDKRYCSIEFLNKKKCKKILYLLRFLKKKGLKIEGDNVEVNALADRKEVRIEMIFGTAGKQLRRSRVRNSKEETKTLLIFNIIIAMFYIFLGIILSHIAK